MICLKSRCDYPQENGVRLFSGCDDILTVLFYNNSTKATKEDYHENRSSDQGGSLQKESDG